MQGGGMMKDPTPLPKLRRWLARPEAAGLPEPGAMALATASPDGRPSVRIVLHRGWSGEGLRFFTNYDSRKARELAANPHAAVVFWWVSLGRQVRVEGRVEPLPPAESDAYFAARPRGNQLGAWASPQSRPVDPGELLARYRTVAKQFRGRPVPRPPRWGGYRLVPDRVEFWLARPSRMHERELWVRGRGGWRRTVLGP
jgi:pyridoxamine 5'-phosphate oxidase